MSLGRKREMLTYTWGILEKCRVRKIKFINHPILNDLEFDFTGKNGKTVDSIIIAGENGTGSIF